MFKRILVAHDGSDGARKALDRAVELAVSPDAALHMISVASALAKNDPCSLAKSGPDRKHDYVYLSSFTVSVSYRVLFTSWITV